MRYHFLNLKHQLLGQSENKTDILAASNKIVDLSSTSFEDGLALLSEKLEDKILYYVILDVQKYKGRQMIDSGNTVIATKSDIITFIADELQTKDLRPIKIMARINPEFAIIVDDELSFCLYQ